MIVNKSKRTLIFKSQVASDTVTSTRNIQIPVTAVVDGQTVTVAGPQEEKGKKKSKPKTPDKPKTPAKDAAPGTPKSTATIMSAADMTVSFVINNVTNPGWSGVAGEMLVRVVNPSISEEQDAAAVKRLKDIEQAIAAGRSSKKLGELPRRFLATFQLPGNEIQAGTWVKADGMG